MFDVFEAYVQNHTPGAFRLLWCCGPRNGYITTVAITRIREEGVVGC
jgi:hypothetical protein